MTIIQTTRCLLIAALSASCGGGGSQQVASTTAAPAAPAWTVNIEPLEIPAGDKTSQPQLTVSNRGVLLSWLEQGETDFTLKFAERSGTAWSAAQKVASGNDWFISSADVPSVIRMRDGTLVANWYPAVDFRVEAYDIRLTYSKDEGKAWARPIVPHHDKTRTQHGFVSMFEMPSGGLGLVWLDGRNQGKEPEDAEMALYFASFDTAWKQTAETSANTRVCECCTTSAVVTPDGVVAAFRDRSPKEVRDIHVSRLENGTWSDAQIVHADNWAIDACPVNGPALSARGRQLAAAWFTGKDDKGQAFAAFSPDAGRTWGAPIRLDDQSSLGHVDIELLDDGSAVATWVEFADGRSQFKTRRVESSGTRSGATNIAPGPGRISGYPRVARSGDELIFAWTEGAEEEGAQKVRGAIARVPRATAP
ncbi:MAG TPA: sialidase family protein [Vicinamibacterales bacterium]|nr:sialidase family protein [Vicinamibacterales bacterium]